MKTKVIAISREFGSGGREIGQLVAEKLGFKLYDNALIVLAAQKSGLSTDFVEENDQKLTKSLLFQIAVTGTMPPWLSKNDGETVPAATRETLFDVQSRVIRELAAEGNCVIIGRCADYVLRDNDECMSVFISGESKFKSDRCVRSYGIHPNFAGATMLKRDKERSEHYTHYTNRVWGDARNYDLCLRTGKISLDFAADTIVKAATEYK